MNKKTKVIVGSIIILIIITLLFLPYQCKEGNYNNEYNKCITNTIERHFEGEFFTNGHGEVYLDSFINENIWKLSPGRCLYEQIWADNITLHYINDSDIYTNPWLPNEFGKTWSNNVPIFYTSSRIGKKVYINMTFLTFKTRNVYQARWFILGHCLDIPSVGGEWRL